MTRLSSYFAGFTVVSEEPSSSCKRLPTISCERDVFLSLQNTHVLCPQISPIDHRLDWVWIGLVWKIRHEVLLQKTVERALKLAVVQL